MKRLFVILILAVLSISASSGPLSESLEALGPDQRANALISLDLAAAAPSQVVQEAGAIAGLWNGGQFIPALERLNTLEERWGTGAMELSINWKTPVPSPAPEWGDDVRIGYRDSIFSVSLARHPASGNLFAVLSWWFGTDRGASANFSDDGGQTWSEVYSGYSSSLNYKSTGVVLGDYYYFTYIFNNSIRLRRRYASTGQEAPFRDGSYYKAIYTATTDTIDEVKLADWSTMQLFCGTIHKNGELNMFWTGDTGGVDWQQFPSPESTARRGLDMHGNQPYTSYYLFLSYFTNNNQVRVLGLGSGLNWDTLRTINVSPNGYFTAIGAYRDTVLATYEDTASGGTACVRYRVSYNGGSSWATGTISDTDTIAYCPDVAMRGGGGTGVVYYQSPAYRLKWRPNVGTWTIYPDISDVNPILIYQPSIEYLGSGVYGIAYISNDVVDMSKAYFDRSDWTGVANGPVAELGVQSLKLLPNVPNPFYRMTTIRYQITSPGRVSLKVYNAAGQLVKTLVNGDKKTGTHEVKWDGRDNQGGRVPNGVYLYRLAAEEGSLTGRMTVVR